jgi:NUDIX domain
VAHADQCSGSGWTLIVRRAVRAEPARRPGRREVEDVEDVEDVLGVTVSATLQGHAVAAAVLVTDATSRWLILRRRGRWQLPGGLVEPGESPRRAAAREARKETG